MLRVLVIEDNERACAFIREMLTKEGMDVHCRHDLKGGIEALNEETWDAVVLDLHLPDSRGWSTVERVADETLVPLVPISAMPPNNATLNKFELRRLPNLVRDMAFSAALSSLTISLQEIAEAVGA